MSNPAIYFGGSRHFSPSEQSIAVIRAIVLSNAVIHVGCQAGADQSIVSYVGFFAPSQLRVFAVAPNKAEAPRHIQQTQQNTVTYSAGGTSAPMPARYLLRSIAAFQGCESAVFFSPGAGSLAVARECIKSGLPVFAFQQEPPARIPSTVGAWLPAVFFGFACWQWYQSVNQQKLF